MDNDNISDYMCDQSLLQLSAAFLHPHLDGHNEIERLIVRKLLIIEEDFRSYYDLWNRETALQREAVDKLWHLTQRYMIAMRVDGDCTCPQIYAIEPEETIIAEYNVHYEVILRSNEDLDIVIQNMRPNVLEFRQYCSELDFNQQTPFILGDAFHKPIKFFMELVDDLFNYYYSGYLKLDYNLHLLDPLDLVALENYQKLLAHSEEFEEYLMIGLTYCKCLQPVEPCPSLPTTKDVPAPPVKPPSKRKRCSRKRAELLGELEPTAAEEFDANVAAQEELDESSVHRHLGVQSLLTISITGHLPYHHQSHLNIGNQ